jgi:hypothetical protein
MPLNVLWNLSKLVTLFVMELATRCSGPATFGGS